MQVVFYGYGTGWHWCYYYSLTCQILAMFVNFYALRYRLSVWDAFPLVKAWNFMDVFSVYLEILLPVPGFFWKKMLHLVPFKSPAWTLLYFYIIVRHFPCGEIDCTCLQTCKSDSLYLLTVLFTLKMCFHMQLCACARAFQLVTVCMCACIHNSSPLIGVLLCRPHALCS
jgi:hypothetical protein